MEFRVAYSHVITFMSPAMGRLYTSSASSDRRHFFGSVV